MKYQYEIVPKDEYLPFRFFYSNDGKKSYVTPHWHDYIEVIYILTGSLKIIINGRQVMLEPDNMIIINSNHIHATLSEDPLTTAYVLQMAVSFLQQTNDQYENFLYDTVISLHNDTHSRLPEIKETLRSFHQLEKDPNPFENLKKNALLYDAVYTFARYFSSEHRPQTERFHAETYTRLTEITSYINMHYTEDISLESTARRVGLSSAYLSRFFRKYIGITFSDYIDMVRLDAAYSQITTTRLPILQIAEECGFANYPIFVKKFKRAYKETPLRLRRSNGVLFIPKI